MTSAEIRDQVKALFRDGGYETLSARIDRLAGRIGAIEARLDIAIGRLDANDEQIAGRLDGAIRAMQCEVESVRDEMRRAER